MPIVIYRQKDAKEIAYISDKEWSLPLQVDALNSWLKRKKKMQPGKYVADIGFKIRRDAAGGGADLSCEMMRKMANFGITLFLSEYSGFATIKKKQPNQRRHATV